jgi:hypothetical protein
MYGGNLQPTSHLAVPSSLIALLPNQYLLCSLSCHSEFGLEGQRDKRGRLAVVVSGMDSFNFHF